MNTAAFFTFGYSPVHYLTSSPFLAHQLDVLRSVRWSLLQMKLIGTGMHLALGLNRWVQVRLMRIASWTFHDSLPPAFSEAPNSGMGSPFWAATRRWILRDPGVSFLS